jgi:hypothetical protein
LSFWFIAWFLKITSAPPPQRQPLRQPHAAASTRTVVPATLDRERPGHGRAHALRRVRAERGREVEQRVCARDLGLVVRRRARVRRCGHARLLGRALALDFLELAKQLRRLVLVVILVVFVIIIVVRGSIRGRIRGRPRARHCRVAVRVGSGARARHRRGGPVLVLVVLVVAVERERVLEDLPALRRRVLRVAAHLRVRGWCLYGSHRRPGGERERREPGRLALLVLRGVFGEPQLRAQVACCDMDGGGLTWLTTCAAMQR